MENSKKRKRDADCPRISYHTSTRTFDRLFQENSLAEMKEVARRKLGLDSRTSIFFAQIRDGKTVDLEDDDDFDAFYVLAHSTNSVNVKVTVVERQDEASLSIPMTPSEKRKRRRDKSPISEGDGEQLPRTPVAEAGDPVAKVPIDAGSESRKKRKTCSDDSQTGRRESIFPAFDKPSVKKGNMTMQAPQTQPDASGEPRKKKKKKTPGNTPVAEADTASRNALELHRSSVTSTNLPERESENVPMVPIQPEDLAIEQGKLPKLRKSKKKDRKPQAESTLTTSSSPIEDQTSKGKEAHDDKGTLSGVQGAKGPVSTKPETHTERGGSEKSQKKKDRKPQAESTSTSSSPIEDQTSKGKEAHNDKGTLSDVQGAKEPVSTKPEIHKSSTEHGGSEKSHEKKQEKRKEPNEQRADVNSVAVNKQSRSSQAAAATKTALNAQQVNVNEVESRNVGKKEDVSSASAKKPRKEPRKLTPDERKAAEADVNAIFAKVLAAKRAAASVNVTSSEGRDDVVSSSKPKKRKNPVSELSQPNPTPANPSVEPSQNAAEHKKSTLTLKGDFLEPGSTRPLEETSRIDVEPQLNGHDPQLLSHSQDPTPVVIDSLAGNTSDELSSSKKDVLPHTKIGIIQTNETSDTSDESSDDESSGHGNELSGISHDPKFLEEVNLDDLIRGPVSSAARIANLDSSDSSEEEEEDNEENQVLEEDEHETRRRSRKSGGVVDSSDETDSGLDDAQFITEKPQSVAPDDALPQVELLPSSGTDPASFRAVDRIGESQEVDRSADAAFSAALEMDTAIISPTLTPQGTRSDPATQTGQSLAPSTRRADLPNTVEVTPLKSTSAPALSTGPSATQPLVSTTQSLVSIPLNTLRDSLPTYDTRDEARPGGTMQRMKTRNRKAPVSEKNLEAPIMSQSPHTRSVQSSQDIPDSVARRTRSAMRRETLSTMTPPSLPTKLGKQTRLIRPASRPTGDLNVTGTPEDVMSLDTWATLKPSSPILDADATMMVDELEPSSPSQHAHMDVDKPNENEGSQDSSTEDPLFLPSESLPVFPYSQWNDESQESQSQKESHKSSDEIDDRSEIDVTAQPLRNKTKKSQNSKYRRLTDITSDHGFLSTQTNLRATRSSMPATKATNMYGRSGKDEIESESESDSDNSDAQEQSHIPKSRRAGAKQSKRK